MATEGSRPVRRAILTALKADDAVTALVPESSIHPQSPASTPAWPFIKYGAPTGVPIDASCVDGDVITVAVHSFAKPRFAAGAIVETAEDHADRIGTAVMRALHRRRLTLDSGNPASVRRTNFQLLQDGAEADAYHHVANFQVRVLS